MALINKLSAIGDAIREKTGKEDLLTLDQMPEEIKGISGGGGGEELEPLVITGNASRIFEGPIVQWTFEHFADKISTYDIDNISSMFYGFTGELIPFDINIKIISNVSMNGASMFYNCYYLKKIPNLIGAVDFNGISQMFYGCRNLRYINEESLQNTSLYTDWGSSSYSNSSIFYGCFSLRRLPQFLNYLTTTAGATNVAYFTSAFYLCYSLDEILDLPIPYTRAWTSNVFSNTVGYCGRLKNFTFALENGQPKVVSWKSQIIDLSSYTGWVSTSNINKITDFNSGIGVEKQVKDDATYQALKNDPDWFSADVAYSRYNHDSAVATINSLPDASAYLATAGGTNTIKFKGEAGSLTDGGAINTLTEEEIAVATNKGWTITFV